MNYSYRNISSNIEIEIVEDRCVAGYDEKCDNKNIKIIKYMRAPFAIHSCCDICVSSKDINEADPFEVISEAEAKLYILKYL